ncbi:MAG: aldehyde dehydrogenase family protein, partial [Thermoleophilia bacterium]|nr:aldehyde dehydrogenase family protein [Thermoleophilia bacterium]
MRSLPRDVYDRLFFTGVSAEVVMNPSIAPGEIQSHVARAYLGKSPKPGTTLVLGAGNVSGMGPIDSLFRLFLRNHTVLLKMNAVNGYMSEVLERGLRALIEEGFLRIVQGGPEEGSYLCDHPDIDEIHVTGSDKTYDAIVFGSDRLAPDRKARGEPLRSKPVAAELGGVGPAIVVPGRWTEREILQGAELVATIAFDGGGFSCGAIDLVVLHEGWPQRETFLDALRSVFSRMPLRPAYYPGTYERYSTFVDSHAEVEFFGEPAEGQLPWALIKGLDPDNSEEMCFSREPFCSVCAEMTLCADDVESFLARAVRFVSERVWGTLAVTLLVPASAARDRITGPALERSIAGLRY